MKRHTKMLLNQAWDYCDEHNKSTEFMIQYMQDYAGVDYDTVIDFITKDDLKQ